MSTPLPDFLVRKQTALFVATGPTIDLVPDWLPHFSMVATFQQAALSVPGVIDYGVFINYEVAEETATAFPRITTILSPHILPSRDTNAKVKTPGEVCIPATKSVTWPHRWYGCERTGADQVIGGTREVWQCYGSGVVIHLLAMLGIRWIFCLGHSDHQLIVDGLHVPLREACEFAADAVAVRYGCRVVFWTPEHTPENWRTHKKRGFLLT